MSDQKIAKYGTAGGGAHRYQYLGCAFFCLAFIIFAAIFALTPKVTWAGNWVSMGGPSGLVAVGPDSKVWVASNRQLYYYNGTSWNYTPQVPWGQDIKAVTVDKLGNVYVIVYRKSSDDNGESSLWKWNGSSWSQCGPTCSFSLNFGGTYNFSLTVAPDNTVWAMLAGNDIFQWTGTSLVSKGAAYSGDTPGSSAVRLFASRDGVVFAESYSSRTLVAYWANNQWNYSSLPGGAYSYNCLVLQGSNGKTWLVVSGTTGNGMYEWNGSGWSYFAPFVHERLSLRGYSGVVGPDGSVWLTQGTRWNGVSASSFTCHGGLGLTSDGYIWSGGVQRYEYGPIAFSLVPSANGPTSQFVIKGAFDGSNIPKAVIQVSTDGVVYQDLFTQSGNSFTLTPDSDHYWVRLSWQWACNAAQHLQAKYSNSYEVWLPLYPPDLSFATGVVVWDKARGRSYVVLQWAAVPNATGYKLHIWDGNAYRTKDLGNVTSWDSRTAKIFPHPGDLPENNSVSTDPFRWDGSGLDFEDTAKRLYRSTVGTYYDDRDNYWFRVTAYNQWMETDFNASSAIVTPTLSNATDAQQPIGSCSATSREGLEKTFDPNIRVAVSAQDALSGVWKVELSNDGVSYAQVYAATKNADGGTSVASYSNTFDWTVPLGAGTKIIYVRVTDAVGNQKVVTDTIALAEDMLPPSISVKINDGVESTTNPSVTLTIAVHDNASVESQLQMRFSNDGTLWSAWEPFRVAKNWDITNGAYGGNSSAGVKKVYAQICDQAQNIGLAVAEIGYNPSPPIGEVSVIGGSAGTWDGAPAFLAKSNKVLLALSYSNVSKVRFDAGIGVWSDWEAYENQKTIYSPIFQGICRLRVQVKDAYGVISEPQEFILIIDPVPPTIHSLRGLNGATATRNSTVSLTIEVSDNIAGVLQYRYQVNGGAWSSYANLTGGIISVGGLALGANTVTVEVKDGAGNVSSKGVMVFKL